jgi:hypothetical protein
MMKTRDLKNDEPYESPEAGSVTEQPKSLKGWHSI